MKTSFPALLVVFMTDKSTCPIYLWMVNVLLKLKSHHHQSFLFGNRSQSPLLLARLRTHNVNAIRYKDCFNVMRNKMMVWSSSCFSRGVLYRAVLAAGRQAQTVHHKENRRLIGHGAELLLVEAYRQRVNVDNDGHSQSCLLAQVSCQLLSHLGFVPKMVREQYILSNKAMEAN